MTRADKTLIICVLLVGIAMYFVLPLFNDTDSHKTQAIIKQEGQIVKIITLVENESSSFKMQGKNGPFIVEVDSGRIRISESACPDKFCVKRGWISSPGESIICVPNEVVIYFDAQSPVDAITR